MLDGNRMMEKIIFQLFIVAINFLKVFKKSSVKLEVLLPLISSHPDCYRSPSTELGTIRVRISAAVSRIAIHSLGCWFEEDTPSPITEAKQPSLLLLTVAGSFPFASSWSQIAGSATSKAVRESGICELVKVDGVSEHVISRTPPSEHLQQQYAEDVDIAKS
ncbi:unnamed protein product [Urochloa humidicola]